MRSSALSLRILAAIVLTAFIVLPLCGCKNADAIYTEGFYAAEAADFDEHGWKEYVSIYVSATAIITVDYNAKNASGFIKSWDMDYMRLMNASDGTYPNKYTREYAEALINRQNPDKVDAITGATHSYTSFQMLAHAALEQARTGDGNTAYVDLTGASSP